MAKRWTAVAAIVLTATVLGGCGGSDDSKASPAAEDAASVVPTDLDQATSRDTDLDGQADEGAALTAEEFCGFLADETPKVNDMQPPEYAAATFGGALFTFYTDKGLLTDIDGAGMDVLAADGCPEATAELFSVLAVSSFEELLSR